MNAQKLTQKQYGVLKGMVVGFWLSVAAVAAPTYMGISGLPWLAADNLNYYTSALFCMSFWLLFCIARLATLRFNSDADIDAAASPTKTPKAEQLQAILQNTLEQLVLAAIVHGAWIMMMPQKWRFTSILAVCLFMIGRFLFIKNYTKGAAERALGFTLTFYPTALMFLILVVYNILF